MAKVIVMGSSAEFPLPRTKTNNFKDYLNITGYQAKFKLHDDPLCNAAKKGGKNRRTRACLALVVSGKTILFDAGPDIKYQLKRYRLKPSAVFITHEHPDANYGLRYLKNTKVYSEKIGTIRHGAPIDIFGAIITPFRVRHSRIAPATGYLVQFKNSKSNSFAYLTDMSAVKGIKQYVGDSGVLFADGSILDRNLFGHLSILNQLKVYKKWWLKRVLFTHIGHHTLPHDNLVRLVKGRYKHADVAYDGMVIKF